MRRSPAFNALERLIDRFWLAVQFMGVVASGLVSSALLFQITDGLFGDVRLAGATGAASLVLFFWLFVFSPDRDAELQAIRSRLIAAARAKRPYGVKRSRSGKYGKGARRAAAATQGRRRSAKSRVAPKS